MYSEKYLRHFQNPRNVGEVGDPDGAAEVVHKGGGCFDRIRMTMKVEDGRVAELKYMVRACSGTIAASSAVTSIAVGRDLSEVESIGIDDVLKELDGIPARKMHSVKLAVKALQETIGDYVKRGVD